MYSHNFLVLLITFLIGKIYGQVALTFMYGQTNGLTGKGFGTMDGAPRNISTPLALLDTAIIKDLEIQSGAASPCGRTIMSGKLEMKKSLDRAEDGGLPDVGPDGKVKIVAHVVNTLGAGPFTCGIDTDANGNNFATIPVTVDVPKNVTKPTDYSLEAQLPNGMKCQGGADGQTCIIRCINGATKGPFGGCMAFTQLQGLFNDPAPAGSGPTASFQLDKITQNPVTREPNLFDDAKAKMSPKDLQLLQQVNGKGCELSTSLQPRKNQP